MKIIYNEGIASLSDSYHGWVNDTSSAVNLPLNEFMEHIAANIVIFKLKYHNENELTDQVETFLDDTFNLFSSYGIPQWQDNCRMNLPLVARVVKWLTIGLHLS